MKKILGSWILISLSHIKNDGSKEYPFGEKPEGFLIYTAERIFSVHIAAENRKKFKTEGLFEGSIEEKAAAMQTFTSYRAEVVWRRLT